MIDFKCKGPEISRAIFGGDTDTICAEICLQIGLIYGALYQTDKKKAKQFRLNLTMSMVDPDIAKKVFSTEVVNAVKGMSDEQCVMEIHDNEEFRRQLEELMKNEGQ